MTVKDRETGQVTAKVVEDSTDDNAAYVGIDRTHESVCHGAGENVRKMTGWKASGLC